VNEEYLVVKWAHVMSSTVLFGTGIGSAFYMFFTNRSRDVRTIAAVARRVVIADWVFTTPTALLQPLTGFYLMHLAQLSASSPWLGWSIGLYVLALACWLPVVRLQILMSNMARDAARRDEDLPARFWRYHQIWTLLGFVAFAAFVAIFYLMTVKPSF
jgi:uncharacterized membrane protein